MPATPRKTKSSDLNRTLMEGVLTHFFVNLALATDADEPLAAMGMGRPHHRILTIAAQAPGVTVTEVLDILRVTHQNARLPMRKLEEEGLMEVRPGLQDRRQRTLHATPKGRRLLERLLARQWVRMERTFRDVGQADFETFLRVQQSLLDPRDADTVKRLLSAGMPVDGGKS